MQAVIDMDSAQAAELAAAASRSECSEHRGVEAAAERDDDARLGRGSLGASAAIGIDAIRSRSRAARPAVVPAKCGMSPLTRDFAEDAEAVDAGVARGAQLRRAAASRARRDICTSAALMLSAIACGSRCAPPTGSGNTSSTSLSLNSRSAVRFIASAATSFLSALFQRIDAQPSGEITE